MISKSRLFLAVPTAIAVALVVLVGEQAVRNYGGAEGLVLANGQVFGGDYLAFYVGGRLFKEDRRRLYDLERQRAYREMVLGPAAPALKGELPFVYPPLVAAALSPLAKLSFQRSFWVWITLGSAASILALACLLRISGANRVTSLPLFVLFALGFVPYSLNAMLGGQITWVGILILTTLSWAILGKKDFLGGMVMGLTYYKPPLFLLLLLVLCLSRGRRFIMGFLTMALVLVSLTFLLFGPEGWADYLSTVSRYTYGQEITAGTQLPPSEGMGLVGLGVTLFTSLWTTVLVLAVPFLFILWVATEKLRSSADPEVLLGLMLSIAASLAFSLQIIKYDLALLLVPMILGLAWYGRNRSLSRILFLLPFLGFFFEFPFRQVPALGRQVNAASFLFLALLGTLVWANSRSRQGSGMPEPSYPTGVGGHDQGGAA